VRDLAVGAHPGEGAIDVDVGEVKDAQGHRTNMSSDDDSIAPRTRQPVRDDAMAHCFTKSNCSML
jgi:hypothetical protein